LIFVLYDIRNEELKVSFVNVVLFCVVTPCSLVRKFYGNILCPEGVTKTNDCQKRSHTPNKMHSLRAVNLHDFLTLILLTWRIWWAPSNASRWQMGFNLALKGLKLRSLKFRKGAESYYESRHVCPSVRMEQDGSHWNRFLWSFRLISFIKICRENLCSVNLLAPEFFFLILAHSVYKMWIIFLILAHPVYKMWIIFFNFSTPCI